MIEFSDFLDLFHLVVFIFRIYCYISISILPFVLYNSFFETRYKPNSNYYHKKEWYHFLKVLWAKSAVNKFKKSFDDVIKNESDESLERPRKLTTFMRSDTQVIYGVDQKGNSLYVRITLREKRLAESCVQIRLEDGSVFQLPDHPLILLCSIPERKWKAKGLEITIIEPFTTLKITYNGFLRNVIRNEENEEIGDVIHCQFNFLWSASTEAKFFPQEMSTKELSEAVAVEPWKDAKWIKLLGFHTGFDQYGTLIGHFSYSTPNISSPTPNTSFTPFAVPFTTTQGGEQQVINKCLRLASSRKRTWGPGEARVLHRMLTLYGADFKGFGFNIGVRSYATGCKELHIGSAVLPNKKIIFVEDCDISLPDFFEHGVIPGAFVFSFKANGKHYKCTAFTHKPSIADMRNEETIGYNGKLVKTKYIINGEEASGYGVFWYRYKGKGQVLPPYIIRPGIQTIEPERKYVASLNSPECRSVYLAGAKGTSLALLTAIQTNQFKTLDGFCILAPALEEYLDKNPEIKEELIKLNDISCGIIEGNLEETCERVQHLFATTPLPQYLQDLVLRELTLLKFSSEKVSTEHQVRWCFAVRGSSVHQDNLDKPVELSDRTFLDCFSDEDVVHAITRCWGTAYGYNKVLYRRKRGLPILCEMAVVVQHTLDAEVSGDLTTLNPATGDPSRLTIKANYGLGLVTPNTSRDNVEIARSWNNKQLRVVAMTTGSKEQQVVIGDRGITKVQNKNDSGPCLDKEMSLKIAQAGLEIETALGNPVKVEWAIYKEQIYMINSVPTVVNLKEFNIVFEGSPTVGCKRHRDCIILNTTDNLVSGSVPCCALSSSILLRFLDQALQRVYDGKETRRAGYRKLAVVQGVPGCDVYQTILRHVDQEITEELKIHEMVNAGRSFVTKKMHEEALARNLVPSWFETMLQLCRTLTFCWNSGANTEEAKVLSQAMKLKSHPTSSAFEHFKTIKRNLHLLKHIIYLHTTVNQSYIFYQKLFLDLVRDDQSDITSSEVHRLLVHFSRSTIYNTPSTMTLLAALLHKQNLGEEFCALPPGEALPWLEARSEECYRLLENLMEGFGPRGVNEFDFSSEPWESNSFAMIRLLQMLVKQMEEENKSDVEIAKKIFRQPNGRFMRWLDTRLHNVFQRRCTTLEAIAVAVNKFRWAYVDLGRVLVHEGKLPEPDLVFHLTQRELQVLVLNKCPHLVERAMKRKSIHKTLKPNISDVYTGTVLPTSQQQGTTFEPQQHCTVGTTVVDGNVTGRACVLENIRQVDLLQPGDILVTKSLDLGWAPYLGLISGLICDSGSVISQGAIVVSKIQLPCIIAQNATNIFRTGDQVVMVGNTGVVEKIVTKET